METGMKEGTKRKAILSQHTNGRMHAQLPTVTNLSSNRRGGHRVACESRRIGSYPSAYPEISTQNSMSANGRHPKQRKPIDSQPLK